MVVRTDPRLNDGSPFPTLYWLTCPAAIKFAGRLESSGFMNELNERLASDSDLALRYGAAHEAYISERDAIEVLPGSVSAGGMPERVKCLHALYAHQAATGFNPIGALVAQRIEPLDCPGPCVETHDDVASPVPGHPHLR